MRKKLSSIWKKSIAIPFFSIGVVCAPLWSQPTSPTVISGKATFVENGNLFTVTTTDEKTIIDWEGFSIGEGEVTYVDQPDATAVTLVRVTSDQGSSISGSLFSNGSVYLINANEIVVGQTGLVDMHGFVASTLDVGNSEFLFGSTILFSGSSEKTIESDGKIEGREMGVVLLSRYLKMNAGSDIFASTGMAELGGGNAIWLNTTTHEITIDPETSPTPAGTGIENWGSIIAARIDVRADGPLYNLAIQQSGFLYALASLGMDGAVYLEADGGSVRVNTNASILSHGDQGTGGSIQILGDAVDLLDQTELITENDLGGGDIFVGGSMGGADNTIINSDVTTVGSDVLIRAGARFQGDSGNVSIYGISLTDFQGIILAKGGALEGNGGTVEISQNPNFGGAVDTRAFNGEEGVLILDPSDVVIGGSFPSPSVFSEAALSRALETNHVVIKTSPKSKGSGNITIAAPIKLNKEHTLTLQADNKIIVSAPLEVNHPTSEKSMLDLNAKNGIVILDD